MKHPLNDKGNGERLLEYIGDKIRFVHDDGKGYWATYNGKKWRIPGADIRMAGLARYALDRAREVEAPEYDDTPVPQGKTEREKFYAFLTASENAPRMAGMIKLASTYEDWWVKEEEFDSKPYLLNFPNGTLDTRTMEFRDHDPEDYITLMVPYDYEPDAAAPKWNIFLEKAIPDPEVRRYLQVAAGYTLTGRADLKKMFYCYGPADTGKSLFCNTLRRALGSDYAVTAAPGALRPRENSGGPTEDIDVMAGKRYVTTSESRPGEPMDEALIKRLTGRDEQRTRSLHKNSRSWIPQMAIWIASNQYPKVSTDDDAIYERIRVIHFGNRFRRDDPDFDERIEEKIRDWELWGVLAWMVEGLRIFNQEGLREPAEVTMQSHEFQAKSDGVLEFISEGQEEGWLAIGDDRRQHRQELFNLYKKWCKEAAGRQPLGRTRFYARVHAAGYPEVRHSTKGRQFGGLSVTGVPSWQASWQPGWGA